MRLSKFAAAAALVLLAGSASAQILQDGVLDAAYGAAVATDPDGDNLGGPTDILGLYFAQDATNFYIALTGDVPAGADWAKWCLYIESSAVDPDSDPLSFADTWSRNPSLSGSFAPQFQAHAWVDGPGGGNIDRWDGTNWVSANSLTSQTFGFSLANGVYEWKFRRDAFNLTGAGTLSVAGWTTGGDAGNPATDIVPDAGNTDGAGWSDPSSFGAGFAITTTNVNDWNMY